ncbi:MAG: methyl-accepting chemotaxis protein, partial [Lachnospiraceae bacterium]|nr:methyl-accepting chemotaxis protein [Lachnospiraceae bacterium]
IADETVANMELVMESVEQATRKMDAISKLLDEESNNFGRIQEGVEVVSSIVDNNSATSEETAAVSQEQKTQVESLVNLIDKFEI